MTVLIEVEKERSLSCDDSFFTSVRKVDLFGEDHQLFLCKFRCEHFDDRLFSSYGIDLPPHIQRSVLKRRAEYFAGRHCAMKALKSLGLPPTTINSCDKGCPHWPQWISGSISHTLDTAVAVADRSYGNVSLGIDVEKIVPYEIGRNVFSQIMFGDEKYLGVNSKVSMTRLLTIVFSVKESFFKAAFPSVGFRFGFDAVSVLEIDLENESVLIEVGKSLRNFINGAVYCVAKFRQLPDGLIITFVEI